MVVISSGNILIVSITSESGIANNSLCTLTMIAGMIARVSGKLKIKRVPIPGSLSIDTLPFNSLTVSCTTFIPTPRPEISVTFSEVEKPGIKIKLANSSLSIFATISGVVKFISIAFDFIFL